MMVFVLIYWNLSSFNHNIMQPIEKDIPTYHSQQTVTMVYELDGKLNYQLIAKEIKNYTHSTIKKIVLKYPNVTWFTHPVMTFFDKKSVGIWEIKANKAKLTDSKILYLCGHVEINNLIELALLKKITTGNAKINLINQNISSNDNVKLYGVGFTVNSIRMQGNFRNQTVKLSKNVKTYYENQQ